jgi:hypothetical protein
MAKHTARRNAVDAKRPYARCGYNLEALGGAWHLSSHTDHTFEPAIAF